MNPTEIVTAVQEGLKITVVISENHGYQCIRRLQMWRTGVSFGNEFRRRDPATNRLEGEYLAIDLARNAESFGARAWHVETPEQLRRRWARPATNRGPASIVAEVEKHRILPGGGVWWDVAPAEVSHDRRPASCARSTSGIAAGSSGSITEDTSASTTGTTIMNVRIGSAPDSWGVWFPSDPKQTPWERCLDEIAEAGYEWTELGPYGYMPTDPATAARRARPARAQGRPRRSPWSTWRTRTPGPSSSGRCSAAASWRPRWAAGSWS